MSLNHSPRIAVLISGRGTNLQAIIDAQSSGAIQAEIVGVISDNPDAYGLTRATAANIPALALSYKDHATKDDFNAALVTQLNKLQPDLVVLAGYMRILPDSTVNTYLGRMINVHPSLLPAYPGLNTHRRVLEAGEQCHGTTVHFVIPKLDAGPPVLQYQVKIKPKETELSLRERVQQGEYIIYPKAIAWFVDGRLKWREGAVYFEGQELRQPIVMDAID